MVAHSAIGMISLLDPDMSVRRVLGGFATPRHTAIRGDAQVAHVTDGGHGELAVVDLVAGRVVRRITVGAGALADRVATDITL